MNRHVLWALVKKFARELLEVPSTTWVSDRLQGSLATLLVSYMFHKRSLWMRTLTDRLPSRPCVCHGLASREQTGTPPRCRWRGARGRLRPLGSSSVLRSASCCKAVRHRTPSRTRTCLSIARVSQLPWSQDGHSLEHLQRVIVFLEPGLELLRHFEAY